MQNHLINRLFSIALPILVAGSVIMLVAYAAIQQSYRQSANDPQIELAEDAPPRLCRAGLRRTASCWACRRSTCRKA
jgi:hypothetical protein